MKSRISGRRPNVFRGLVQFRPPYGHTPGVKWVAPTRGFQTRRRPWHRRPADAAWARRPCHVGPFCPLRRLPRIEPGRHVAQEIGWKATRTKELEKPQITPIFADSKRPRDLCLAQRRKDRQGENDSCLALPFPFLCALGVLGARNSDLPYGWWARERRGRKTPEMWKGIPEPRLTRCWRPDAPKKVLGIVSAPTQFLPVFDGGRPEVGSSY